MHAHVTGKKRHFAVIPNILKSLPDSAITLLAEGAPGGTGMYETQEFEINVLKMCHLWDLGRRAEFNKNGCPNAISSILKSTVGAIKSRVKARLQPYVKAQ